jgi:hypothetical protein
MTSDETSMVKQRFFDEHLPGLKPTGEKAMTNKPLLQKQPKLPSSSIFSPIPHNLPFRIATTNSTMESPQSTVTYSSTVREAARQFMARKNLPSLSPRSSSLHIAHNALPRRSTRYDHISSKINTGLPRTEGTIEMEDATYQIGPTRPLNWCLLTKVLEQDKQIRAQAKRIKFNSGVTYTTQITTLTNLVRSKVKSHISSVMHPGEERYKIVVQLHVFQTAISGLHIASRCLWNTLTDNSIKIKMQGVDCDILIIVFLCYTDLGAI